MTLTFACLLYFILLLERWTTIIHVGACQLCRTGGGAAATMTHTRTSFFHHPNNKSVNAYAFADTDKTAHASNLFFGGHRAVSTVSPSHPLLLLKTTSRDDNDHSVQPLNNETEASQPEKSEKFEESGAVSLAMISTLGFYKTIISPLLPPACRFVPTCSQYGVQAIEKFGPGLGVILIAWRLLRCSPMGGKGYDPPTWPPVSFRHSSY